MPRPCWRAVVTDPSEAPRTTIVVVTLDNLIFNRLCLESLLWSAENVNCEIVVVDNGSTDGTVEYLRQLADRFCQVRIVLQRWQPRFRGGQ